MHFVWYFFIHCYFVCCCIFLFVCGLVVVLLKLRSTNPNTKRDTLACFVKLKLRVSYIILNYFELFLGRHATFVAGNGDLDVCTL